MNDNYFIKYIFGPAGQDGYPADNIIHFQTKSNMQKELFKDCAGFLLHETWKGDSVDQRRAGASAIFAYGTIDENQKDIIIDNNTKRRGFTLGVRVKIVERVDPRCGIPCYHWAGIIGVSPTNIQRPGGILNITQGNYKELKVILNNVISGDRIFGHYINPEIIGRLMRYDTQLASYCEQINAAYRTRSRYLFAIIRIIQDYVPHFFGEGCMRFSDIIENYPRNLKRKTIERLYQEARELFANRLMHPRPIENVEYANFLLEVDKAIEQAKFSEEMNILLDEVAMILEKNAI